jgi:hypothetical protein
MSGGNGNDHIRGNMGNDKIYGDAGNDLIAGDDGNDHLYGGDGDDCLSGGAGRDFLYGDKGNDKLNGGLGDDVLDGGLGDDFLMGAEGNDVLRGDTGQSGGGSDLLVGGLGNDSLFGGKDGDCLVGDEGNDVLTGGADGDNFVFGHGIDRNGDGVCEVVNKVIGHDVITDFDADQEDRVIFHTAFEGTLSATLVNGNRDVLISSSLGGTVLIVGLVAELEGIDPTDPFFDPSALIEFLTKPGIDGDGKGIITFEDKCITPFACEPDQAVAVCKPDHVMVKGCIFDLDDDRVGNTTISTTEARIADMFVEDDANVWVSNGMLHVNLLAE